MAIYKKYAGGSGRIDYYSAGGVSAKSVVELTSCIGIAIADIAAGKYGDVEIGGNGDVWDGLAAITTQTWTAGTQLYWDTSNDRLTSTASGNLQAGIAANTKATATATASVMLGVNAT